MKRLLFVALALIVAGSAVAEDQFGLWRVENQGAWNELWLNYVPMEDIVGFHTLYVVLHDRSLFNIAAFEVGINWPSFVFPTALDIPNNGINFGDFEDLLVGYNIPVVSPDFTRLVLATLTVFVAAPPAESAHVEFRGAWLESIPGHNGPVVAAGFDFDILVACGYYGNDPDVFLFGGTIATESATWSSVKALFN